MMPAQAAPRIAVPPVIDAAAWDSRDPAAPIITLTGTSMGTSWRVLAAVPVRLAVSSAVLGEQISARLAQICAQMSHWDASSCLSRFNRAPCGTRVSLSDDFAQVMACAFAIAQASGGAFDPALGRLTDLWGLGPTAQAGHPDAAALIAVRTGCGWQRLAFDPATRTLTQPGGVWLDLSGIAKGYAVDTVADLLGQHGIAHALVEIGGEISGRGMRPDGDPWWVEIENPPCCALPPLRVAAHQIAVASSGDYLRGAHTLDPATGLPVTHATTAVSVLHASCMVADAWATALSVADPERARNLARTHQLAARIVSRCGHEWFSPALQVML